MTVEEVNYKANFETFAANLKDAYVYKLILSLDTQPTFDLTAIPFRFQYAFSATFLTDRGNFNVRTSATSNALETFWTEKVELVKIDEPIQLIESVIANVHFETMKGHRFPFKMTVMLSEMNIVLYCADIYDSETDKVKYSINDEMLLIFDSIDQANIFEGLAANG